MSSRKPKTGPVTPAEARNIVGRYARAMVAVSWLGGQPVEEHAAIEAEAEEATKRLHAMFARLRTRPAPPRSQKSVT